MSEINCNNCAVSDFKESLCHRCDEMKRLGRAEDIEGLLIKAFSEVDSPAKSDCIDRQAAIGYLMTNMIWYDEYGYESDDDDYKRECITELINGVPSAQSEIIRCRDCKHWDKTWTNDWSPDYHYCPMIDGVRKGNFYCADAERRTDE